MGSYQIFPSCKEKIALTSYTMYSTCVVSPTGDGARRLSKSLFFLYLMPSRRHGPVTGSC
ncbi:hypothetical protein J2T08_001609 [Neorhizobium galegae]|nr:hypothetical protein [Neorhizobium galegae]